MPVLVVSLNRQRPEIGQNLQWPNSSAYAAPVLSFRTSSRNRLLDLNPLDWTDSPRRPRGCLIPAGSGKTLPPFRQGFSKPNGSVPRIVRGQFRSTSTVWTRSPIRSSFNSKPLTGLDPMDAAEKPWPVNRRARSSGLTGLSRSPQWPRRFAATASTKRDPKVRLEIEQEHAAESRERIPLPGGIGRCGSGSGGRDRGEDVALALQEHRPECDSMP